MHPGSQDPRVEAMFRLDRAWAAVAVTVLWLTYAFVFFRTLSSASANGITAALVVAGGLVLLFITTSIVALIRHYQEDKRHIYELDLHYLDEMKKNRR